MSLYKDYLAERTDDKIIETEKGFVTYRYLNERQVYIIDIFVLPEFRLAKVATQFADIICQVAKERNCTELVGTVVPSCKGATESILVLIAYGMKVSESANNLIVFKKDI